MRRRTFSSVLPRQSPSSRILWSISLDGDCARVCVAVAIFFSAIGPRRFGCPVWNLDTELLGVLGIQPLPATEPHRIATGDAANRSSAEKMIQNIEANVPPGSAHRDEAPIDVAPEGQPRAGA